MRDLFSSSSPGFKQEPLDRIYALLHKYKQADKRLSLSLLEIEIKGLHQIYEGLPFIENPKLLATYTQQMAALNEQAKIVQAQTNDIARDEALLIGDRFLTRIVKTIGIMRAASLQAPEEYLSAKECAAYPNIALMVNIKEAMKPLTQRPYNQFPDDNFPKVRACAKKAKFLARLFVDVRRLMPRNGANQVISDETFSKIMKAVDENELSDILVEPLKSLKAAQDLNDREKILQATNTLLPILEETASHVTSNIVKAYDDDVRAMIKAPCYTDVPFVDSENQHPVMRLIHRKRWEQAADALCAELNPLAYQQGIKAASQLSARA